MASGVNQTLSAKVNPQLPPAITIILYLYGDIIGNERCSVLMTEKDCGLPKAEPHMTFNTSQGTRFRAVMRVFCDKGWA